MLTADVLYISMLSLQKWFFEGFAFACHVGKTVFPPAATRTMSEKAHDDWPAGYVEHDVQP